MGKGPKGGKGAPPSGQTDQKKGTQTTKAGDQKTASKESTQKGGKKGGKK
ncbi:hypothetical protein TcasGA2_TC015053 [Tribolium castaneum]|uniref:Uncharacterized protein n=1 Tax=Tribolium castaneum TaxID=7070 RepID=D2A659_TRICA|nr:hypothetical protein TcasGA2_TC015053 [Tribolium castaneum]